MTHLLNALAQTVGLVLAAAARRTANLDGTGIDVLDYEGVALIVLNASAGTGTDPTLEVKLQHSDDDSTYADVTDLVRDTGYKPETSVEVGVSRFVDWYRSYYAV